MIAKAHEMVDHLLVATLAAYFLFFLVGVGIETAWRARGSAAGDRRLVVNFGLGALGSLIAAMPWLSAFAAAQFAADRRIGLLHHVALPGPVDWLIAATALSFQFYWQHRAMHAFDALWKLHRVHHSDREMDVSTGFRAHPGEYALDAVGASATVLLLGIDPVTLALALLVVQLPSLLVHANARLPEALSRVVGTIFVTPDVHLRHHSSSRAEHDSNYGNALIVWDRLFGTYDPAAPQAPLGTTATT